MARKRKVRKHHNAFKRAQRVFGDVRLWSWESNREHGVGQVAHGMCRVGMVWRQLGQNQVTQITKQPNNWIVMCRAFCKAGGEVWVEQETRAAQAVKVSDFEDMYAEMRKKVFESVQHRHVIDCGWIIQSYRDIAKLDNEYLPIFELGEITEQRRTRWLLTDNELRDAA